MAKIAESFICRFFDDHFCDIIDKNQFGSTKNRSTTHALIKFSHELFSASDNSGNIIRALFVDFAKAFDLVDHNVLMQKMIDYDFPPQVTSWSLSFLQDREQFVKINNCLSSVTRINSGCPQGTLSGPNNFKLLINDLRFRLSYIKYVDDTSVVSVSNDPSDNSFQIALNDLTDWCTANFLGLLSKLKKW